MSLFLMRNELESAEYFLRKALKYDPRNIKALNNLGTICFQKKDYDEAAVMFEQAVFYEPEKKSFKANLLEAQRKAAGSKN